MPANPPPNAISAEEMKALFESMSGAMNRLARQSSAPPANLQPFDETHETFTQYLQRLDNYLNLRGIVGESETTEKKKVQIFINCLPAATYALLTSLTAPEKPDSKTFAILTKLLRDHLCPQSSVFAAQHKFLLRVQHEGESISNFIADLRTLSAQCEYKCTHCEQPTTETHLRSQFIRGVRDGEIRERLLQQAGAVTFEKIGEIALAVETSKAESRQLQQLQTALPSHQVAVNSVSGNFSQQ
jgi:hypothetical protein